MARSLRVNIPGLFFHVTARGNNRGAIFLDKKDYLFYLVCLKQALEAYRIEIHAYCLMPNHVHLLIRSMDAHLPRYMHRVHTLYASWFNKRHERTGHLFQGRYHAKIVLNEPYLYEVGRYIHMNPVTAGLTQRPEDYPWSSLRAYLRGRRTSLVRLGVLSAPFSKSDPAGFYRFTVARQPAKGDEDAASEWYSKLGEEEPPPAPIPPRPGEAEASIGDILQQVATAFECRTSRLRSARRDPTLVGARAAAALLLRHRTPLTTKDVMTILDYRSYRGMANSIASLKKRAQEDSRLGALLTKLLKETVPGAKL